MTTDTWLLIIILLFFILPALGLLISFHILMRAIKKQIKKEAEEITSKRETNK